MIPVAASIMQGDGGDETEKQAGDGGEGGTIAIITEDLQFNGEISAEGGEGGDVVETRESFFVRAVRWLRSLLGLKG